MIGKIIKAFTVLIISAMLTMQCMAVNTLALVYNIENYGYSSYFYYKGIYYSFDTDASNVAQRDGGGTYTTVTALKVPSRCNEKWLDPTTWRIFDTKYQAEVENGVLTAHLIFVDPNYKEDTKTAAGDEKNDDTAAAKKTVDPSMPVIKVNRAKTETAKDGEPYVLGKKSQAGWARISENAEKLSNGSFTVVMNGCETIDKSILEAVKDKNVTVVFSFSNGINWQINGKKVTSAKNIEASVIYNTKTIPAAFVKKASENAVSKSQLTVSDSEDGFGCTANITVKFDKKRAGLSAAAYRYDPEKETMKKVSSSKVGKDGKCTFSADKGGAYLIVLNEDEN